MVDTGSPINGYARRSFFLLWYETLSTEGRDVFKDLVQSGRFEFVGGARPTCTAASAAGG